MVPLLNIGLDIVDMACELAIEDKITQLPAIINQIHRLTDIDIKPLTENLPYPKIKVPPKANCERYNQLITQQKTITEVLP